MDKKLALMGVAGLAIVILGVWFFAGRAGEREPAEIVLKQVPAGCKLVGVWRNEDYPDEVQELRQTIVLCRFADGALRAIAGTDGAPNEVVTVSLSPDGTTADDHSLVINPDGSLTVFEAEGWETTYPRR